jgi:hypothetical protein
MMNANGTSYQDITPADWPAEFLCSHPIFSEDDSAIYFVGQWWEDDVNAVPGSGTAKSVTPGRI